MMRIDRWLWLAALACGSPGALAQTITELNMGDVYFRYRPAPRIPVQPSSRACGFMILGNHESRKEPRVEWDLNIDMLVSRNDRVAGVSAGTFNVVNKQRQPRQPVTAISFIVEGDSEAIPVHLVGPPNADNGVRGVLDFERSAALFWAFAQEHRITITLTYADATTDVLKARGYRDSRVLGGGKNSPFYECMRGVTPPVVNPRPVP
ncbi:MAG TPA: hypothetical protein VFE08_13920 [Candidatus Sulfotelmatobacter sp.]|nr:hypothetical protein [Candidatus Sulfotelmatobacter sp.]